MMLGVERTSPATASAMPNLGPGLIFIISACLRFERFEWKCKYTRAKIFGTLVCLSGAMCLSFLKSPTPSTFPKSIPSDKELSDRKGDKNWILGCLYMLTGVTIFACNTVLQAATLKRFPAPSSVCTSKVDAGTADNVAKIVGEIMLVRGVVNGDWPVHSTPGVEHVLVSMFSPFQTAFSAFVSLIFFGRWILGVHLPHLLRTIGRLFMHLVSSGIGCS